ncbi:class I adenylate-forming enzyme family protein [Sphingomonas sp. 37zxx]|uniref:class I adenylate-forming enzyme family protein n=1 Tax=Sphingomonas sp. 37zxx TaxID=1550073 RepID=UPI0006915EEB|nr:fatty acid--CoA ligase family protein [Sphingomonas sp. 37zxx]
MSNALQQHLQAVARIGGDALLVADGRDRARWSELRHATQEAERIFAALDLPEGSAIGILVRNAVPNALAILATLSSGRCAVYFNGLQPIDKLVSDITGVRPAILLGAAEDFTDGLQSALDRLGVVAARVSASGDMTANTETVVRAGDYHRVAPGSAIEIQTSGTTGTPKRIVLRADLIMGSMKEGASAYAVAHLRVKRSPTLLFAPLGHAGGTFALLLSAFEARPTILFDKFRIPEFRAAMAEHRPRFLSLPPPMLRMVLESDMTREELSSLLAVRCGTAPLAPATQKQFEDRFGIPVLITYGATEFMGALARWTLNDHKTFIDTKRGSVGRISPDTDMRVVDAATGEPVAPGEIGILEVRGARVQSHDWLKTTDLARIDTDRFLFIAGRADDAIIRGGFKILASQVVEVLNQHDRVHEAAVIGVPDARLGEVPVAAIEPKEGVEPPTPEELEAFARKHLIAYQVPAQFLIVAKLPRTVSLKVSRPDVRALFANR